MRSSILKLRLSFGSRRAVADLKSESPSNGNGRCTTYRHALSLKSSSPTIDSSSSGMDTAVAPWLSGHSCRTDDTTFLTITESGWTGDRDQLLCYVGDSTQGFAFTLA